MSSLGRIMDSRRPRGAAGSLVVAGVVIGLVVPSSAVADSGMLSFGPPHRVTRSRAKLDGGLAARVDALIAEVPPRTTAEAIRLALAVTSKSLHFGLGHRTRLAFSDSEREGNCIEYSHLFAAVFERAARRGGIDAAAFVVHSDDARLLGGRLPLRGMRDHDWVLVEDRAARRRFFIDPTLADAGLDWDISGNVRGTIAVPRTSKSG